jgi:hypothetical protein
MNAQIGHEALEEAQPARARSCLLIGSDSG